MIELVVFDMAGTTVYDGDAVLHSLQAALQSEGIETERGEINAVMGITKPVAIAHILTEKRGVISDKEEVNRIYKKFLAQMLGYYREHPDVREVEGATQTFQTLRSTGIKIGLDTGFSRPIADTILARLGWNHAGLIDATVTSDEVENGRPAPDMILRLMELTGVSDMSNVVKVGDTPSDLQQGTSAGCRFVVGVTEGSHTRAELELLPHTHLIGTVAELPKLLLEDS